MRFISPGETITSRSLATFEQGGSLLSVVSNEVSLDVLALFGPVLLPDGTTTAPANIAYAFSGERTRRQAASPGRRSRSDG